MIVPVLAKKRAGKTEADIVVAVVGLVPVAVGRAEVVWLIVPGTAAQNAGRRGCPGSGARFGKVRRRGLETEGFEASDLRLAHSGVQRQPSLQMVH